MKKCFVLLVGVGVAFYANAQQHISFGPTVGFGHSWISTENAVSPGYDSKFHSTYNVGVKMVYSLQTHWGVSADLKYSSEGGSFKNGNNELVYRANYIRLPLQAVYFFGEYGDRVRPKISLGPSFGFLVGGDTKYESNDNKISEGHSKDMFKTFDAGLTGAVGANIRVARNTWLNTDIGYYHGLTNMNDVSSNNMKNRSLGLNVGLAFGVGTGTGPKSAAGRK